MKKIAILLSILFVGHLASTCVASRMAVLFSPRDKPTTKLIELINGAQKTIQAAVYMLTDVTIAQALINAKKNRNVEVTLILDQISTDKRYGKAELLAQNGIKLLVFDPKSSVLRDKFSFNKWAFNNPIMHNKFGIFDGTTLWTGSFNWTVSANILNCENVIITDNREMCKTYSAYHKELVQNRCNPYVPETAAAKAKRTLPSFREQVLSALQTTTDDLSLREKIQTILIE